MSYWAESATFVRNYETAEEAMIVKNELRRSNDRVFVTYLPEDPEESARIEEYIPGRAWARSLRVSRHYVMTHDFYDYVEVFDNLQG